MNESKQPFKNILLFILPIILGQMGQVIIDAENIYLAAKDSLDTLAVVGIAEGLSYPLFVMGLGMHFGLSPLLAKFRGNGQHIQEHLPSIVLYSTITGFIFIAASLPLYFLVEHFGYDQKLVVPIQKYLIILLLSYPFAYLFQGLREYYQSKEEVIFSNGVSLFSIALNLGLNYLLLFHYKLGPIGLALGTLGVRFFMAISLLWVSRAHLHLKKMDLIFLKSVLYLGLPIGLSVLVEESSFAILAAISGTFSELQEDAEDVVMTLANISFMVTIAISSANSTQIGHALGERRQSDLKRFAHQGILLSFVTSVAFALLLAVFPDFFIGLFTKEEAIFPAARKILFMASIYLVVDGLQGGIAGVLRGIGKTKQVFYYFFFSFWILGAPLGFFFAYYLHAETMGLWCALFCSDLILLLLCLRLYWRDKILA